MTRLVADIGGTNVRFAAADTVGRLSSTRSYRVDEFASFDAALSHYLASEAHGTSFATCAVGAAGPVDGGEIRLTNNNWRVTSSMLADRLGGVPVALVNDLEAVAAALPHLAVDDVEPLGAPAVAASPRRAMLALNIGTGFGAAAAIRRARCWCTVPSEAGHMSLTAADDAERIWIGDGATVEGVLSGPALKQCKADLGSPVLASIVGRIAGDLALATGAWDGVFLCGSVASAWAKCADVAAFRRAFEAKGPMRERMRGVPTSLIVKPDVALFGLAMIELDH